MQLRYSRTRQHTHFMITLGELNKTIQSIFVFENQTRYPTPTTIPQWLLRYLSCYFATRATVLLLAKTSVSSDVFVKTTFLPSFSL